MNVLIVGGAGYVGSHTVRLLRRAGHNVWVYDNLCRGHREAVAAGNFIQASLEDVDRLTTALREHRIDAVMHFAAFSEVAESAIEPAKYYRNNVVGTIGLLDAMRAAGVSKIVFSSSCATYGIPKHVPITERERQHPISPYGSTKLMIEQALEDYARAYGLAYAALRYFNAAGASPDGDIGEDHSPETHLIPIALQVALGKRAGITLFGNDYPTADGTCIRDYIHVDDLGDAHIKALERLRPGKGLALNLGTGQGHSVLEVVNACRHITGHPIPVNFGPRRAGDAPRLIADSSLAQKTLDWKPKYPDIRYVVETAWRWHSSHPSGYTRG